MTFLVVMVMCDFDFSPCEIDGITEAVEATFMDSCEILPYTVGGDDVYGKPIESWGPGIAFSCGYNPKPNKEVLGQTEVPTEVSALRLPIETSIDHKDRVKLTHRYGNVLDNPLYFEVYSDPMIGLASITVLIKNVTDGING